MSKPTKPPAPKFTGIDPKNCPHRDLEFELGGKVLACRDCGQRYQALEAVKNLYTGQAFEILNHGYHNIWILHRDRRTWAPALAEPPKKP